jgi:hypothetical protein
MKRYLALIAVAVLCLLAFSCSGSGRAYDVKSFRAEEIWKERLDDGTVVAGALLIPCTGTDVGESKSLNPRILARFPIDNYDKISKGEYYYLNELEAYGIKIPEKYRQKEALSQSKTPYYNLHERLQLKDKFYLYFYMVKNDSSVDRSARYEFITERPDLYTSFREDVNYSSKEMPLAEILDKLVKIQAPAEKPEKQD